MKPKPWQTEDPHIPISKTANIPEHQEMIAAITSLKMRQYQGAANECKSCKKKGNFGSIVRYLSEEGNWFILCGWCGKIEKLGKQEIE